MKISVYSDGSATIATKPGGYGFVLLLNGQKYSEGSGAMQYASNNDAELEAATQGLLAARKLIYENPSQFDSNSSVELVSDSQLVLGWLSGLYRFKQEHKKEKYENFMKLVTQLRVTGRWVEGHSGDPNNERCDQLANEARRTLLPIEEQPKSRVRKAKRSKIGTRQEGIITVWYGGVLKVIDLVHNFVETYDEPTHGPRTSRLEVQS